MEKDLGFEGLIDEKLIEKIVGKKVSAAYNKGVEKGIKAGGENGVKKGVKELEKELEDTQIKLDEVTAVVEEVTVKMDDKQVAHEISSKVKEAVGKKPVKIKQKVEVEQDTTYKPKYNMFTDPRRTGKNIADELRKHYKAIEDDPNAADEKRFVGYYARAKADGMSLKDDYTYLFEILVNQSKQLQLLFQGVTEEYAERLKMVVKMEKVAEKASDASPRTSSPASKQSIIGEEAIEAAGVIDKADEKIEESNDEVEQSEEELEKATVEARQKSSSAAKEHADEVEKAKDKIVKANEEIEDSNRKIIGTTESDNLWSKTYQDESGRTFTVGEKKNKKGEWIPFEKELTSYTKFESEAISITNRLADAYANLEKAKRNGATTAELDAHQQLIEFLEKEEGLIKDQAESYFSEQGLGAEYTQQLFDERVSKTTDEHALKLQIKTVQEIRKENEKSTKESKKQTAEIAKANRFLNTQEKIISRIEKTYDKTINPDLEKSVTNQDDLDELSRKKSDIQTLINKLKGSPRDSSNEKDYLMLEKLVAEYEDLAKYKKRANNPTKGELGGQSIEVAISTLINDYKKLIEKAEAFGDQTSENVRRLKDQLEILEKVDVDGKHTATSTEYDKARDLYKVERSNISLLKTPEQKKTSSDDKVIDAYKTLTETEKRFQELSQKKDIYNNITSKEAQALDEITKKRDRANAVLAESLFLNEKQMEVAKKYATKQSDVNASLLIGAKEKEKQLAAKMQDEIEKIALNKKDFSYDEQYDTDLEAARNEIAKLVKDAENINFVEEKDIAAFIKLREAAQETLDSIKKRTNNLEYKTPEVADVKKKMVEIQKIMDDNTRMPKDMKEAFEALQQKYQLVIDTKGSVKDFKNLNGELEDLKLNLQQSGKTGKSFFTLIKQRLTDMNAKFLATYFSFQDIIRYARKAFETIKQYDTALTEMNKVSDESINTLKEFQKESFNLAKNIGATASSIQDSTSDFMRLGYSLKEAKELAESTNIYSNVGDMEISEATEHMISSVKAWSSEFANDVEASKAIADRYNEIGNNFAITSADIGAAMERSAAALKAGGNTLNESLGLITAGNLIQQDAETTANAIKVLSLRIRGSKTDLEEMGEETEGLATSTSKLREEIKALTGVDIMLNENTYKSTAEIIKDIGKVWNTLDDVQQANVLEKLAGKTRASTISGLLENYDVIDEVIERAEKASGSALRENEAYMESIEGHIKVLSNELDKLLSGAATRDFVNGWIEFGTTVLKIINDLGGLKALLVGAGGIFTAIKSFKNEGRVKMFTLANMPSVI